MISATPLISIITVVYNGGNVIKPTIESVIRQSCTDYEYIVIDGASTDDTVSIVRSFNMKNLSLVSEKDNGIYDAMNKGLSLAKGKYVIFLNAGDAFASSNILQSVHNAFEEYPETDVFYGQTIIINDERKIIGHRHLTAPRNLTSNCFQQGMVVCHQAFFARREIAPYYNTDYKFSADYDWCLKILDKSHYNHYLGDRPIIKYLQYGTTTANHKRSLIERFNIMEHRFGLLKTILSHIKFIFRSLSRRMK